MSDDAELYRLHIFHETDHARNLRRLKSDLLGWVVAAQDQAIRQLILGRSVLDVGAGYGTLAKLLIDTGHEVTAIDPHRASRELARQWFGVEILDATIYALPFADRSFETVILRDVIEHLDLPDAIAQATRLADRAVVVYCSALSAAQRLARRLLRHEEYRSWTPNDVTAALRSSGFRVDVVQPMSFIEIPLSGGFVGPQLWPHIRWTYPLALAIERALQRTIGRLPIARHLAWRTLIRSVRSV